LQIQTRSEEVGISLEKGCVKKGEKGEDESEMIFSSKALKCP
jgi:hypothetical protein